MRARLFTGAGAGAFAVMALVLPACGRGGGTSRIPLDATTAPAPTTTASTIGGTAATGASTTSTASPRSDTTTEGTWRPAVGNLQGLPSECGNLSYVWGDPSRDVVMVGVALQGLFVNEDGSENWTRLGTGAGSAAIKNRASSILRDPDHPDTFWESGIYAGGGVYRTDDNGSTFRQLGDVTHSDHVSVDLSDPSRATLLTGRHEESRLFRSRDGGRTWDDLSSSLPEGIGNTIAPHVIDADTYLLGTFNGPQSGVYRSADRGATWTRVVDMPVASAPVVAGDGTITWLLNGGGGTIRSVDQGRTWTRADSGGVINPMANVLVGLPDGGVLTIGNGKLITSKDGGVTWRAVGPRLPYQPNGVAYAPARNAYYVWRFDCSFSTDNPIAADAIMRWDAGAPA